MEAELYKVRSLAHCVKVAYDLFSTNIGSIIRRTWRPAAALSLVDGLFMALFYPRLSGFHTADMASSLPWPQLLAFVAILCATLACSAWFLASVLGMLNGRRLSSNLPRVLRMYLAIAGIGILFVLAQTLLTIVLMMGAGGKPTPQTPNIVLALVGVTWIAFLVCMLPLVYSSMKYFMEKEMRLRDVFGKSYRKGWRFWGFLFLMILVTGIIIGVIYVVVMSPQFILFFASSVNADGGRLGDPSGLPGYFPVLTFLVTTLCTAVWLYVMVWLEMVFYYAYGHIEAKMAAKAQLSAAPHNATTDDFPPIA